MLSATVSYVPSSHVIVVQSKAELFCIASIVLLSKRTIWHANNDLTHEPAMNASVAASPNQLTLIQTYFTRYFMIPVYIFGNFGNIMNIVLFFQHSLRLNNISAWYFIGLSVANLLFTDVGGLTRTLPLISSFNLETTVQAFCKFRLYFTHFSLLLCRYFICLISIDRWIITSSNESLRRMSSARPATYLIIFGTCFIAVFTMHVLIGFEIQFNRCSAYLSTSYTIFFNIYNFLSTFATILVMIFFSILIVNNIRQSRNRIQTIASESTRIPQPASRNPSRRNQMKFLRLVLLQSLAFTLLNSAFVAYAVYDFVVSGRQETPDQQAVHAFFYAFAVHPIYIFSAVSEADSSQRPNY